MKYATTIGDKKPFADDMHSTIAIMLAAHRGPKSCAFTIDVCTQEPVKTDASVINATHQYGWSAGTNPIPSIIMLGIM